MTSNAQAQPSRWAEDVGEARFSRSDIGVYRMTSTTAADAVPNKSERLTPKAWIYIVAAIGFGMLLGMKLTSTPMQTQIDGWKEMAASWKQQALDYKAASEQNAAYASRWELEANKALDLAARCATPPIKAN